VAFFVIDNSADGKELVKLARKLLIENIRTPWLTNPGNYTYFLDISVVFGDSVVTRKIRKASEIVGVRTDNHIVWKVFKRVRDLRSGMGDISPNVASSTLSSHDSYKRTPISICVYPFLKTPKNSNRCGYTLKFLFEENPKRAFCGILKFEITDTIVLEPFTI
jgi:hypothetical protein